MSTKQRAEPLSPEERRRSIVEAMTPLLLEKGARVTTSEIADAAGIAEGTIFRVFHDKNALLFEACKASFDPAPELALLTSIDPDLPLEDKLREAAAIIVQRQERVHALASVLRSMPPPSETTMHEAHRHAIEANSRLFVGVVQIFLDEQDRLSVNPTRAAAAFGGLMAAVHRPFSDPDELLTADEAVDVLLDGVLMRAET